MVNCNCNDDIPLKYDLAGETVEIFKIIIKNVTSKKFFRLNTHFKTIVEKYTYIKLSPQYNFNYLIRHVENKCIDGVKLID